MAKTKKKQKKQDGDAAQLEALMKVMTEQALPVQRGGFEVDVIPTGIHSFDASTGVGGVPRRRITLLAGREGSGKTLILLALIANVQRSGGRAAFIDAEHALTPGFARLLGVDYESLVISRPRTLEQCYDVARPLISSGLFDVVGFDSVVALSPEDELSLSAADSAKRAGEAQIHSKELKKVVSLLHDRTALVLINQIRVDPNPPAWWTAGPKEYEPGGNAIPFYSSLRVRVKQGKPHKGPGGQRIGQQVKTQIIKNKVAPPFRTAEFDIRYTDGIDAIMGLVDGCISFGIIYKKSSWYYCQVVDEDGVELEEYKWNGREKMEVEIKANDELRDFLIGKLSGGPETDDDDDEGGSGWDAIN